MSIIQKEDIIAFLIDDEHVCWDCLGKHEDNEGQPLTEEDVDNDTVLKCDRCNDVIISK